MDIWLINEKGQFYFCGGKQDRAQAKKVANECYEFALDDEDEQMAEDEISCYNCRYRRWTKQSFICMKR